MQALARLQLCLATSKRTQQPGGPWAGLGLPYNAPFTPTCSAPNHCPPGLLDAVKGSSAASNQQVSAALDTAQSTLDTLNAVPQAVAGISRSVKDAIDLLVDTFREAGCGCRL